MSRSSASSTLPTSGGAVSTTSSGSAASPVLDTAHVSAVVSIVVAQVEAKAGGSPLAARKELLMFNDGVNIVYFGPTGVASTGSSKGIPIAPGDLHSMNVGPNLSIFLITGSTGTIIVQELS